MTLVNPLLVRRRRWRNFRRIIADAVQQSIEARPIRKAKSMCLAFDRAASASRVLLLARCRVADEIRNLSLLQKIKDVRPAIHAAGLERAFLLGEIEEGDVLERDVVEIEVTLEFKLASSRPW